MGWRAKLSLFHIPISGQADAADSDWKGGGAGGCVEWWELRGESQDRSTNRVCCEGVTQVVQMRR